MAETVALPPGLPPPAPATPATGRGIPLGKREKAVVWLAAQLESGPLPARDVVRRAKAARITHKTLRRAKTVLGVRSVRVGGVGAWGLWAWVFPPEDHSGD